MNNNINERLLDRFLAYCRASRTDPGIAHAGNLVYVVGISVSRFTALADSFRRVSNAVLEYHLTDSLSIILDRLEEE